MKDDVCRLRRERSEPAYSLLHENLQQCKRYVLVFVSGIHKLFQEIVLQLQQYRTKA